MRLDHLLSKEKAEGESRRLEPKVDRESERNQTRAHLEELPRAASQRIERFGGKRRGRSAICADAQRVAKETLSMMREKMSCIVFRVRVKA